MIEVQIIDGYCGTPNIYADDIGQYNISLFGSKDCVLPVGEQLGYELVSNNEIKIKDGLFVTQGRRGAIKRGTTESCIIENGAQTEKRKDLIVIEYRKDEVSQVESHMLKVIKGMSGETAEDPEVVTGDIPSGDAVHQMPLYRVTLEGLNITAIERMFTIGKIAPETVDPMATTESGFAADALATKNAITPLQEKMASFEQAKSTIINSALGKALGMTAGTALATVASLIAAVVNRGAWNSTITTANGSVTIPAGYHNGSGKVSVSGLYVPPQSQSGSVTLNIPGNMYAETSQVITFPTPFTSVPTVSVGFSKAGYTQGYRNVTKAGFTIYWSPSGNSSAFNITATWNAVV